MGANSHKLPLTYPCQRAGAREKESRASFHHSSFFLHPCQQGLLPDFARKADAFHDGVMMALLWKEWLRAQKLDRPGASIVRRRRLLDAAPQAQGKRPERTIQECQ